MESITLAATIGFLTEYVPYVKLVARECKFSVNSNISYLYDTECRLDKYVLIYIEYNNRTMDLNISTGALMPIVIIDGKLLTPSEIRQLNDKAISDILA